VTARLDPARRAELTASLASVRYRLDRACRASGRDPASVLIIAVTKGFPPSDVAILTELGIRNIGENRDQEARAKIAQVNHEYPAATRVTDLRWHFVGQLQTNKCRSVARYADAVHSVDRRELVVALSQAAQRLEREIDVFVQVGLDDRPGRGGALPADVAPLADLVAAAPALRLVGVMAVAPLGADPDPAFATLAEISSQVQADHPTASAISAGMSADVEAAIRHGATHVRIGTALLGRRNRTLD
jgi:PLP dependent protein